MSQMTGPHVLPQPGRGHRRPARAARLRRGLRPGRPGQGRHGGDRQRPVLVQTTGRWWAGLSCRPAGNELHHFGWNACSSALCHQGHSGHGAAGAPLPDRPRHPVLADLCAGHQARPPQPTVVRAIEAEELAAKAGYSRPHTVHCGPGGIFLFALGGANGNDGPGGVALLDHDTFDVIGAWELDRGDQFFGYDGWWHLNHDTVITSEWGTPSMIENGLNPEDLLGRRFGHHLNFWSMSERTLTQRIDLGDAAPDGVGGAPGPRPGQGLGVRRGGHQRRGPVRVGVALAPRRGPLGRPQGHHHPGRAGRPRPAPARAQALRGRAAADLRHRPVGGRPLAVRVLLGHRGAQAVRRQRHLPPARDRLGQARRHRAPPAPPGRARPAARRRPPDGRDQPRRPPGLCHQLALRGLGRHLLPRGVGAWMAKLDADLDGGGLTPDARFFPNGDDFRGLRVHQTRLQGGDASSDSYCHTR